MPHGVRDFGEAAVLWFGHLGGKIHSDFGIIVNPRKGDDWWWVTVDNGFN